MKRKYILLILLLPGALILAQEVTKTGTTAASFLNIDVGARGVAMGSAFVSAAEDVTGLYWNPSGIARMKQGEAIFSHTRWIADIAFNYAAIAVPLGGIGALGASATFLTMDEMERTTVLLPEGTGETFTAGSYAFGLHYAKNLTDRFSIGFGVKYVNEKIYNSMSQGVAFDVGTLFDTQFNGVKLGMSITNYGTKMRLAGQDMLLQTDIDPLRAGNNNTINANLQTDAYDLPLMFRVGLSVDVLKGIGDSNLLLCVDALHPNDDVEMLNVGAEYMFHRMICLRAGYKSLFAEDSEEGLSLGGGFQYRIRGAATLFFDYAYHDFGVLNSIQKFSLRLGF